MVEAGTVIREKRTGRIAVVKSYEGYLNYGIAIVFDDDKERTLIWINDAMFNNNFEILNKEFNAVYRKKLDQDYEERHKLRQNLHMKIDNMTLEELRKMDNKSKRHQKLII